MILTTRRWLYRLILAMDANFRLKNRLRSNSKADPGLGTGWAYFVPEEAYREHILKYVTQEEVRFFRQVSWIDFRVDYGLHAPVD